jgi:hypothetical protein
MDSPRGALTGAVSHQPLPGMEALGPVLHRR